MTTITACRLCGGPISEFLALGDQPLANGLEPTREAALGAERYPLALVRCLDCGSVQQRHAVDARALFESYPYASGVSASFRAHFDGLAETLTRRFKGEPGVALDVGSNDGELVRALRRRGWRACGVEPAGSLAAEARISGAPTVQGYWSAALAARIVEDFDRRADLVTACNVFAHDPALPEFLRAVRVALQPVFGLFVAEVYYLPNLLRDGAFDAAAYHEHVFSHHVGPLRRHLRSEGFDLLQVEDVATHGGSIRLWATVGAAGLDWKSEETGIRAHLERERDEGLYDPATYARFGARAQKAAAALGEAVRSFRAEGRRVVAYTAPAKLTVQLCAAGLTGAEVEYAVDDAPIKIGKWIPGAAVPIVAAPRMAAAPPDVVVLGAWNLAEELLPRLPAGVQVIVPVPDLRVIQR